MNEDDKCICPKCGGEMVCGVMVDRSYTACEPQQWKEDCSNEEDMYTDLYNVISYRCKECGFLENYAFKADTPKEMEEDEEEGPPIL